MFSRKQQETSQNPKPNQKKVKKEKVAGQWYSPPTHYLSASQTLSSSHGSAKMATQKSLTSIPLLPSPPLQPQPQTQAQSQTASSSHSSLAYAPSSLSSPSTPSPSSPMKTLLPKRLLGPLSLLGLLTPTPSPCLFLRLAWGSKRMSSAMPEIMLLCLCSSLLALCMFSLSFPFLNGLWFLGQFWELFLVILRDVRGFLSGQKEQVLGVIGLQMPWDWCFCFRELDSFYITVVLCGNLGIQLSNDMAFLIFIFGSWVLGEFSELDFGLLLDKRKG